MHTKVKSYVRQGNESVLATEDNLEIRARHVVFATGYESQQFLKQRTVRLISSYAIASAPKRKFPRGYEHPVIWETARPYLYVRGTLDGRIVAGGEDVNFVDEAKRDRLLASKTKTLERKIRKMFPDVPWELAAAWTGTFAESKDGLPYIGPHEDFSGAQFALGYGGNGITFSAIASSIIPDLISGIKNKDAHIFRFGRKSNEDIGSRVAASGSFRTALAMFPCGTEGRIIIAMNLDFLLVAASPAKNMNDWCA